ncbi:MAG: hypothetical protein AAGA94_10230 [Pseudomonadota bacterium]
MLQTKALECEYPNCEAEAKVEGSTQGLYCAKCQKWLVAATYIPAIDSDMQVYRIIMVSGDFRNTEHVKAISNVSNVNFLQARNALRETAAEVIRDKARTVQTAASLLNDAGIRYRIEPDFPYGLDQT